MKKILLALILVSVFLAPRAALATIGNPIISVQSSAAEASHVLKSSAGYLNSFSITTSTASGYVMFFDATSAPVNGSVTPKLCFYVPSYPASFGASYLTYPVPFVTGIVVEFSTTGCFTATSSATAFFQAQVQ